MISAWDEIKSRTAKYALAASMERVGVDAYHNQRAPIGTPLIANIRTTDAGTLQACTVSNVTRTTPSGATLNGVKITPTSGQIGIAHFTIPSTTVPSELIGFLLYIDSNEEGDLKFYIDDAETPTASFAYDWQTWQPGWKFIVPGRVSGSPTVGKWSALTGSPVFGSTTFTRIRVRCNATTPQTKVEFYGCYELPSNQYARPVSRVSIGADDGRASIYSLGAGIVESYGARLSLAPNAPLVGSSASYMTLNQLLELKARGHEIIAQNTGTLGFEDWVNDGDRDEKVATEVAYARDYLLQNGLSSNGSEKVFVYDHDYTRFSSTDTGILDALLAAGYIGARGPRLTTYHGNYPCAYGFDAFGNEVITLGYSWNSNGSTEAANVARIIAQLNECAETGRDAFIYIHDVVSGSATTANEISAATLVSFLRTVAANALLGKQRFALHTEMFYDYAGLVRPYL